MPETITLNARKVSKKKPAIQIAGFLLVINLLFVPKMKQIFEIIEFITIMKTKKES